MEAEQPRRDMRDRIVDAATRLFADRGYEGVSLQSIADAVGIRKPSLLYHFPTKDALRTEVMERMLSHWKEELPRILAAAQTGKDRFRSGMGALVRFFTADPNRARLVVREMLDQPGRVRSLLFEHFRPWTSLLSDYIRMGQQSGSVRTDVDPESWVTQVVTMVIGTVACGDVTEGLVKRPDEDAPTDTESHALRLQIDELVRVAGSSLFNTRPSADAVSASNAKAAEG